MRGWEGVFRRKPVIDGNDPAARTFGQPLADHVVTVEISQHEPATVEENDAGTGRHTRAQRRIEARLERASRAGHPEEGNVCHFRGIALDRPAGDIELLAQLVGRVLPVQTRKVWHVEPVHELPKGFVERHGRKMGVNSGLVKAQSRGRAPIRETCTPRTG